MKEHSGGSPDVGYIPLDNWNEESFAVPIEHFDYSSLDTAADIITEAVLAGRDIEPILKSAVNGLAEKKASSRFIRALMFLARFRKPKLAIHQMAWLSGMSAFESMSCEDLAKRHGITKQAFVQGAHRICKTLGIRPGSNMRDESAREKMSKARFDARES